MKTSKLLAFEKLNNIRDLGGMVTSDGRRIIEGRLVRCGNLSELSDSDRTAFTILADTVIDFRTDGERNEKPDMEMTGIQYHHIPVISSLTAGITREKTADRSVFARFGEEPQKARQYMRDLYRTFAESDYAAAQYARFIRILLRSHKKAIVWHCTAGKDRAGVGAAIIEEILGVERDDVIDDYLMTNECIQKDIRFLTEFVKEQAGTGKDMSDEALRYLFGAEREYIEEYYQAIVSKYGSFDRFIRDGLKLTGEDIHELQRMYLM